MNSFRVFYSALLAVGLSIPAAIALAQTPKPVVVAEVIEAEVKSDQRVVGTVHPLRTSTIGSAIDGRVAKYLVNAGDPVEEGQVLAQLRTKTLDLELAVAKAELELYQQRLAELKNGSRPEDIAEAEANMLSAQAALKNADGKLQRIQSLALRNAASKEELEDAKELSDAARFSLQAMKALHTRIKGGPRTETIAQAQAQVELQQQRLNLAADRIVKSAIVAPFDGFVSAEFIEVGAWITRGDAIVEVIQLDEVEVLAPVTAEAVVHLRKDDVVRVEFPELPDELFTGEIERIVPISATRTRTFPVRIRLKNQIQDGEPLLLAGMLARVNFPAGKRELLPLVPKDALVLNGADRSVFVIDKQGAGGEAGEPTRTVRKVSVDLGVAVDDRIQVRGELKAGDLVVIGGNERLLPNAEVEIVRELKANTP